MNAPHWYKKPVERRYGRVRRVGQILEDMCSSNGVLGARCPPDRIDNIFNVKNKK